MVGSLAAFLVFACFSYPFNVLPLLVLFTLLLAQCTPMQPGSRWLSGIFYTFLFLPVYFLATGQQEREQAYKRWKSEQIYFNMQIFERTVDNYKKLYPLLKDQPAFLFRIRAMPLPHGTTRNQQTSFLEEASQLSADPMIRNIMGKNYQTMKQYTQAESAFLKASHGPQPPLPALPTRPNVQRKRPDRQSHHDCPPTTRKKKSPKSPLLPPRK